MGAYILLKVLHKSYSLWYVKWAIHITQGLHLEHFSSFVDFLIFTSTNLMVAW